MSDAQKTALKRILIADDVPSARDLVRSILVRTGYEIIEASDGEEALDYAIRFQPDLVILDLQMPKIDGCSVASKLRSMTAFASTPILALSAGISQTEAALLSNAGFSKCLAKPIRPAVLRSAIAEMFDAAAL